MRINPYRLLNSFWIIDMTQILAQDLEFLVKLDPGIQHLTDELSPDELGLQIEQFRLINPED